MEMEKGEIKIKKGREHNECTAMLNMDANKNIFSLFDHTVVP